MVFQDYALFPHLNVADNIGYRRARTCREASGSERVDQMLDLVGLADAAGRAPHQLSGGQQQRIALARALAPAPRLLLLDEPFSNLDVDLRERLAQEVRADPEAQPAPPRSFVTHDQLEAFALGDVIGVMNAGRLEQWDDAYTLYHRPATPLRRRLHRPRRVHAGADRRRSGAARACRRRSASWRTPPSARCRKPSPAASATCCCAPTTSSTTTTAR